MCSSEYDLVCEECRRKFDRIFSVEIKSAKQERELLAKWLKSLCNDCKKLLKKEGFIAKKWKLWVKEKPRVMDYLILVSSGNDKPKPHKSSLFLNISLLTRAH
jgi:hypothetical protein